LIPAYVPLGRNVRQDDTRLGGSSDGVSVIWLKGKLYPALKNAIRIQCACDLSG
jgi:hypothetical protein